MHYKLLTARCIKLANTCCCSYIKLHACVWLANYLNPVREYYTFDIYST